MLDRESVNRIAYEYYSKIYAYCRNLLPSAEDAQDATQEVFLLLLKKSDKIDEMYVNAWLYAAARRKVKERLREIYTHNRGTVQRKAVEESDTINSTEAIENLLLSSDEELYRMLDEALSELSKSEYFLFELIYSQKVSRKRVAQILDTNEKALNVRVCRLRKKIVNILRNITTIALTIVNIF